MAAQPELILSQKLAIHDAAIQYIESGWKLVPLYFGTKRPCIREWTLESSTITSTEAIDHFTGNNFGLAHAYSGTCAVDIDDLQKATEILDEHSINLPALLMADNAVQIKSGRDNRAKLLYRTPEILPTFQHCEEGQTVFEFRCGTANGLTVQDVLPPSIHPITGQPYEWLGDWRNIPPLPEGLLDLWRQKTSQATSPSPLDTDKTHRRNIPSVGVPITSMGVSTGTPLLDHIKTKAQVRTLFQTEPIQRNLLSFLGFTDYETLFKHGRATVRSVVPPYDKNKSGGLILAETGDILFRDFSGACGNKHVPLQVLYARLIAGRFVRLTPTEKDDKAYGKVTLAVCAVRLLMDAGIVKPALVELPPCPNLRSAVEQFHAGVKLLFQVRWAFNEHYGQPVTMGRVFMSAWCGLTEQQARDAIYDLLIRGVIHTASKHGWAHTFLPGPGDISNKLAITELD